MGKKKKTAKFSGLKKKVEEPVDLYKVILEETDRPAYLGAGVPKQEAERLATGLVADCYIEKVD